MQPQNLVVMVACDLQTFRVYFLIHLVEELVRAAENFEKKCQSQINTG